MMNDTKTTINQLPNSMSDMTNTAKRMSQDGSSNGAKNALLLGMPASLFDVEYFARTPQEHRGVMSHPALVASISAPAKRELEERMTRPRAGSSKKKQRTKEIPEEAEYRVRPYQADQSWSWEKFEELCEFKQKRSKRY